MRSRRGFGATLALAMGVGPLVLYALSALSPLVVEELQLSRAQFGSFATFSFAVAASSSALSGRIADAVGGRRVLGLLFTTSAAGLVAAAVSGSFAWVLVAVAVSGFSQSLSNPVTNQQIATHVPAGQRGLLMGVKQSGVQMSQFAAGLLLPTAALVLGWRVALALTAASALIGLVLTWRYVPAQPTPVERGVRPVRPRVSVRALPEPVWWLAAFTLLMGLALQATNVYLPLFSYQRLGLGLAVAGLTAAVGGGIGVLARIAWGRLAEAVATPYAILATMAASAGVGVALLAVAGATQTPGLVWVGAVVHGLSSLASNVVVMLALVQAVEHAAVGTATGLLAVGLYVGFAAGPISFGALVDATGSYELAWTAAVLVYAVALALVRVWRRRSKRQPPGRVPAGPDLTPALDRP